nr:unnamed protein product [Callosobruchus analis]
MNTSELNESLTADAVEQTQASQSCSDVGINDVLKQLVAGMVHLQKSVESLSLCVQQGMEPGENKSQVVDRSYLVIWKELGGYNLSFNPNGKLHPTAFLKKIKKLFDEAGVPEQSKVSLVVACMKGAAADWAAIKEPSLDTFAKFERDFIARFWGLNAQRELFLELNYGKYEMGSRAEYFSDLFVKAGFLTERIPEDKLIRMIGKHFSTEIQRGIITRGLFTFEEVDEYLRELDEILGAETVATPPQNNGGRSSHNQNRWAEGPRTNWRQPPRQSQATNHDVIEGTDNQGRSDSSTGRGNNNRDVWQITKFNEEPEYLCSDGESDDDEGARVSNPTFHVTVGGQSCEVIIDSGSEITGISEEFCRAVESKIAVPTLPVSNVNLAVAIGGRKQRVKKQIVVPVEMIGTNGNIILDIQCLVVPGLNCDIILGCDWLTVQEAKIDFGDNTIKFSIRNTKIQVPFQGNEVESYEMNLCKKVSLIKETDESVRKHAYSDIEIRG